MQWVADIVPTPWTISWTMPSTVKFVSGCLAAVLMSKDVMSAQVTLPYGTFVGLDNYTNDLGNALPNPLVAYLNIPYAAPPTGTRRFARPEPPLEINDTALSTEYGPICPQSGTANMDEDCLSLAVFAPKGTTASDKLPVVIWIHGGAFNGGSKQAFSLASMVSNAPVKYIGVSINYRLGALGFLPSSLSYRADNLNLGLYDQHSAIEWVQKYVSLFGGDPQQVTLFGESAGATAVGYHLLHVNGTPPFQRVIMDSGGPTARAFPNWTYPLYQTQAEEFLDRTGCYRGENETATFACLRELPVDTIRGASVSVFNKYNAAVTWPFQPVIDYQFIARSAHQSWESGQVNNVSILTGFNSDEGSGFVPRNINTTEQFQEFFKNLAPAISGPQLDTVANLYPAPDIPGSSYANSPFSLQFSRIAAAYGDFAYIAQVQANAIYASKLNLPVWKYHFAYLTPGADPSLGVVHASELQYVSTVVAPKNPGQTANQSKLMNAYWSSFIVSGDPNKIGSAPAWPRYTIDDETQIRFSNGTAYSEPDNIRRNATNFWRSIPDVLMH
ncbi:carboxylesterase [Rhizoctonia solani 123E]|uniref:Carboxylic ester hydrolase n=1 Tax=Rhizoctonia solani 123E TaxID=1423351 RepID=A0A074S1Y6_9AGAM|nr:carboxylesterase [Rhizoctonia solani 123E]